MNDQESLEFIRAYFAELFGNRNIAALDLYLDKDYFDDDIGDPNIDHIQNSKEFLTNLFKKHPSIGVEVSTAITQDSTICAYLEWFDNENNVRRTLRKGVAIFMIKDRKILKRHTYIYYES